MRTRAWALWSILALPGCGGERGGIALPPSPPGSAFRFAEPAAAVRHDIPLDQIRNGVGRPQPRDAIRALRRPLHGSPAEALDLHPQDRVLAVAVGEAHCAYPLHVLDGHEVVNDVLGGRPVLVTWCPLCRSAMVFEREVGGAIRTFGVSGYLWNSAVLLYDDQSESFWSQIAARAVVGPLTGTPLRLLPSTVTSWGAYRAAHPEGFVLRVAPEEARPAREYRMERYAAYHRSPDLWFPVQRHDPRLADKQEVVGVERGGASHAWALSWLRAHPEGEQRSLGGVDLTLRWEPGADQVEVLDGAGAPVPHLRCSWFAWAVIHPGTGLTGGAGEPGPR